MSMSEGIIEQNILIANFMEWQHHEDAKYDAYEMSNLKYHSSWDWLMPVWGKCYNRLLEINSTTCHFYINDMKNALISADIKRAFETLVSAIEFINE